MFWSISESRTFRRCQRQWYFKNLLASATAKDETRREAYLLSKLQTVSAWRGNLVDKVVSDLVIPALRFGRAVSLGEAVRHARTLYDTQLAFARRHPLRDAGLRPAQLEGEFAAFYAVEYKEALPEEELSHAWQEVEAALGNLFGMAELFSELRAAALLAPQRALSFPHSGMTVRAVPDVVAFYRGRPPLIVDWKVHAFGHREAWLQLATYAVALTRCAPHKDFPPDHGRWRAKDVRLAEAQLLTNRLRRYELAEEDEGEVDAYVAESVTQMLLATGGKKGKDLTPEELPAAASPDACRRCPFRKLCWEDNQ
jgi:hypothetical protein